MNITLWIGAVAAAIAMSWATPAAAEDAEVRRIMRKFKHEPTVRDVQRAAIKYYRVSPKDVDSLRTRARAKSWLPGVSASFTNALSSYSLAVDDIVFRNSGIAVFEDQNADYLGLSVTASWSLDRLIFNSEELDVLSLVGIQDAIQREVTTLYYVRRRLQIQLLLKPPKSIDARVSSQLRLDELTALLDAYTGGYFSKRLDKGGKRTADARANEPVWMPRTGLRPVFPAASTSGFGRSWMRMR